MANGKKRYFSEKVARRLLTKYKKFSNWGESQLSDEEKKEFERLKSIKSKLEQSVKFHKLNKEAVQAKRQTNLTKDQFKGGTENVDYTMNTGGGQPISAGKKWPDEPEKERVEQPHAPNGEFTYNSLAGLDKVDKRDRAKGSGWYGDDPSLTNRKDDWENLDHSGTNNLGKEYLNRKNSGVYEFKKGESVKLHDGSVVYITHDISIEDFYKYYMTNYKDRAGRVRNALLENGLIVKIGKGKKLSKKDFNDAAKRWSRFLDFYQNYGGDKVIAGRTGREKTLLPKILGNYVSAHSASGAVQSKNLNNNSNRSNAEQQEGVLQ